MEITSLDLSVVLQEFRQLEEGFVQQVYQRENELTLEIYVPGDEKKRLIIGPSYVFISKYKRDNPERPPGFCMELRKHLGKIDSIEQRGFDRILEIESGDKKLVAELFGKGNVILLDSGKVIGAVRQEEYADRAVVVGEDYRPPEPANDPREGNYFELMENGEIVRKIASDLSLGGTYAEEVCERAGINKDTKIEELEKGERERIENALEDLLEFTSNPEPALYLEDGMPSRAAPFPLETYSGYEKEGFDSFSEALDEYFYRHETKQKERQKQEAYDERREGLERQKQQQEMKIEGLKKSSQENREKAEAIYENYQILEEIKKGIEDGIEEHGWDETKERIRESDNEKTERINSFNEREGFVTVDVDGLNIRVEPFEDLEATSSRYYDRAKNSEEKIESAQKALQKTEEKLSELEKESVDLEETMEDKTEKRGKKWFEKYRWFYSSEGFLVCIGRDAQTNEMLAKKHMEENDLYFHADFDGAPTVVVKDGQNSGEETRQEAAKAAVTFSKTWKAGIGADSAYYVDPEQVTKDAEPGEYLTKGAFVIRGDRNYIRNVSVDAAIGPYEIEEETYVPMCGPEAAIDENCPLHIKLKPGRSKKSEIGKKIQERFREEGYRVDLDYIIRALPPGKSDIE